MNYFLLSLYSFMISYMFLFAYKKIGYKYKIGMQTLREDGPAQHFITKKNTLTMGGFFVILSLLIYGYQLEILNNSAWICLLLFAAIGSIDDVLKIRYKSSLGKNKKSNAKHRGLSTKQKFCLQILAASICAYFSSDTSFSYMHFLWSVFFICGVCNAVNISDGLDGLITVPLIFCFGFYAFFFNILLSVMIIGALLAFLCFNRFPAKIFMGDVGSLGFGALLAFFALKTNTELYLIPLGFIFLIEILSVILQVLYMKKTKKRLFLMSPIHHHFEHKGYKEKHIVYFIWIMQFIFLLLSCIIYQLLI